MEKTFQGSLHFHFLFFLFCSSFFTHRLEEFLEVAMPQEKQSQNRTILKRPTSASMSNTFNPALPQQFGKPPLPAIKSQVDTMETDDSDLVLPMKVFQAKKTSVKDLSQALCAYLWFRRIKEIFLVMGKQNDAFTRFDMQLARTDMIQTCDQYLENERPKEKVTVGRTDDDVHVLWKTHSLVHEIGCDESEEIR